MKELKVFDQLTSDIATLVGPVSKLKVTDFKSSATAVEYGRTISVLLKEIDARKDELVAPHLAFNNQVYEYVREMKLPLTEAKDHLAHEAGKFAAEQRRLAQIEAAKIEAIRIAEEQRIAAETQAKLDALEADKEEAVATMDPVFGNVQEQDDEFARQQALIVEEAELDRGRAITAANNARFAAERNQVKGLRMEWDCELIDMDAVPVQFQVRELNRAMILAMARASKTPIDIPGVRVFQKPSMGFGQNTYVPREALRGEATRERAARVLSEPVRQGRRAPGTDVQPARRAMPDRIADAAPVGRRADSNLSIVRPPTGGPMAKPFASKAQMERSRGLVDQGIITKAQFDEQVAATDLKTLPERLHAKSSKPAAKVQPALRIRK